MRKKLLVTLVVMLALVCMLALSASAERYKINYDNKSMVETDDNGTITLKDTAVVSLNTTKYTIKDANGNDIEITQQFLGWYTEDGRTFEPGETVTFTEDTRLFQASGAIVYNATDLNNLLGKGWWCIKLGADIEATTQITTERTGHGAMCILDLNGHNFTSSAENAFGAARSGIMIVGEGTVTHTGKGHLMSTSRHSWYDGDQRTYIGRDVTVTTNGALLYAGNDMSGTDGIPKVKVWGKATAKTLANIDKVQNAVVELHDGADVTLTGDKFIVSRTSYTGFQIYVNIYDAKLTVPNSFTWYDVLTKYDFTVVDGSMNVIPTEGFLNDGYSLVKNDETGYYDVTYITCTNEGSNGAHTYVLAEGYGDLGRNCTEDGSHYYRCACGSYYVGVAKAIGHNYSIIEIVKEATESEAGTKKAICSGEGCGESYTFEYMLSPILDAEIKLVAIVDGEIKEITKKASEIFTMNVSGSTATITGIIYDKTKIVKLYIPSSVVGFGEGALSGVEALNEVIFMDGANVAFTKNSISNCPKLEKITLGVGTYTFAQGANENAEAGIFVDCPSLDTIDMTNANVTFNKWSFASNKYIKHIPMGTGKTYVFMEDAFRHASIEEVIIPDNSTVTLGKKCFAENSSVKYLYIGKNAIASKSLGDDNNNTSVFGGCMYLSKVILMDITYAGKWSLSTKKYNEAYPMMCDLHIYIHSTEFKAHNEAFNDRDNLGKYTVYVYSANPSLNSITASSNYVIFKGIGHAYTQSVVNAPTCEANGQFTYVTDCPCGIDYRNVAYTSSANKRAEYNGVSYEAMGEGAEIPMLGHILEGDVKGIVYSDGFLSPGYKQYICSRCNQLASEQEPSCKAIFTYLGYSMPEDGSYALSVGYSINKEALKAYNTVNNTELEFGGVMAIEEKLNGKAPLDSTLTGVSVIKARIQGDYSSFDLVIGGFNDTQLDLAVVMCTYVYDGTKYVYLQDAQVDIPSSQSINGYLALR